MTVITGKKNLHATIHIYWTNIYWNYPLINIPQGDQSIFSSSQASCALTYLSTIYTYFIAYFCIYMLGSIYGAGSVSFRFYNSWMSYVIICKIIPQRR